MSEYHMMLMANQIRELREEIERIKRALAGTRITIEGVVEDGDEAPKHARVLEIAGRDAGSA